MATRVSFSETSPIAAGRGRFHGPSAVVSVCCREQTPCLSPGSERPAAEVELLLQAEGVPAHAVVHTGVGMDEPQLRGHFFRAPHAIHGDALLESTRYRLSRTPARVERAGPTLGEHTEYVLAELLGYDADRIESLRAAGALG